MFSLLAKPKRKPKPLKKEERVLSVGDKVLPLTIREHAKATRITLRIEPGGRALRLTVPTGLRIALLAQERRQRLPVVGGAVGLLEQPAGAPVEARDLRQHPQVRRPGRVAPGREQPAPAEPELPERQQLHSRDPPQGRSRCADPRRLPVWQLGYC